ncbi:hypothetical protein CEXT_444161 [Caerostris extrusa]|uniref:Uncharacterized protein n=1 Tax=Caerostris extrusa TaxID=172846 RepID=A0AAV4P6P0_CAEEX|nr:hypothetical protein CEXT_444161 [Caerostris extrusa]
MREGFKSFYDDRFKKKKIGSKGGGAKGRRIYLYGEKGKEKKKGKRKRKNARSRGAELCLAVRAHTKRGFRTVIKSSVLRFRRTCSHFEIGFPEPNHSCCSGSSPVTFDRDLFSEGPYI